MNGSQCQMLDGKCDIILDARHDFHYNICESTQTRVLKVVGYRPMKECTAYDIMILTSLYMSLQTRDIFLESMS